MSMQKINILVIGDIMLDTDIIGNVNRISPEAPIPIIEQTKVLNKLGGAAKVAETLDQYIDSVNTDLIGIVGDDGAKKEIEDIIKNKTCINYHVIVDFDKPTTVKTRFYSSNVPLLRYDVETLDHDRMSNNIVSVVKRVIDSKFFDGVILSDYEKGIFTDKTITPILDILNNKNIPVFVDPKKDNIKYYKNCEIIKINEKEMNIFINDNKLNDKQKVKKILELLGCKWLIVTRGKENTYVASDKLFLDIAVPQVLFENTYINCIGAGDLFMSKLTERYISTNDIVESINPAAWFVKSYLEKYHNANV